MVHGKKRIHYDLLFDQNDTVNPYHLFLNVRNNNDYPFSNMYLIVTMKELGKTNN